MDPILSFLNGPLAPHNLLPKLLFGGISCDDDYPLDSDMVVESITPVNVRIQRSGNRWTFRNCYPGTQSTLSMKFKYYTDLTVISHRTDNGNEVITERYSPDRKTFSWWYDPNNDPTEWVEVIMEDVHTVKSDVSRPPPTKTVVPKVQTKSEKVYVFVDPLSIFLMTFAKSFIGSMACGGRCNEE